MIIHREGYPSVLLTLILFAGATLLSFLFIETLWISVAITCVFLFLLLFTGHFFRLPGHRPLPPADSDNTVFSPCDGKVVAIEKIFEKEYFNDERIQVSVFMSPMNIHINWYPISGIISYFRYYKGLHLVAWEPKSSELNERTTVVIKHENGQEVLFRQVAGKVARRVVSYAKEGKTCRTGEECGFIKFGSRVDIILPLTSEIQVKIGQKVSGTCDAIASLQN